jgi:hypothetical protein
MESPLECRRRFGTLDHDQIIVLALEPGRGKVRGAGAQQSPVDLVALEVHWRGGPVLGPNLDARRLGKIIENFRGVALGKLRASQLAHRPRGRFHVRRDR